MALEQLVEFHFLRPWWFAGLPLLAGLVWWLSKHKIYTSAWEKICDAQLLPFVLLGKSIQNKKHFLYWLAFAGALAIVALAGPTWERLPQPTFRDHSALVIALDLSRSMDAVDIQPSRLQRARYKISDFVQNYRQEVALVTYSDEAYVTVPLTNDATAIDLFLQSLSTDLMPSQGSRPDKALRLAEELFKRRGVKYGGILLVTDYGDQRAADVAEILAAGNYRTAVLGVGTEQGAPIFLSQGGLLKDQGDTVVPELDEAALRRIAVVGDGIYQRLNVAGNTDIDELIGWAQAVAETDIDTETQGGLTDAWYERGPWLLLPLLPLAAMVFRRGVLVLIAVLLLPVYEARALSWEDLWLRSDQQAMRSLEEGDPGQAAELFENEEWQAAAKYRNNDYAGAAEILQEREDARSLYNTGNAFAQQGKFKEAVEAYNSALKIEPKMDDAIHNRQIVNQLLQQIAGQPQSSDEPPEESDDNQQQQGEPSDGEPQEPDSSPESGDDTEQASEDADQPPEDEEQNSQDSSDESGDSDPADDGEGESDSGFGGEPIDETELATEQMLQQVQDNPGGLLKRKFSKLNRDKRRRGQEPKPEKPW